MTLSDFAPSHFGAVINCMIMGMFGTAQDAPLGFPVKRPVFLREYSTNTSPSCPYFFSKMVKEFIVVLLQNLVFVNQLCGMSCRVLVVVTNAMFTRTADELQLLHDQFQCELRVLCDLQSLASTALAVMLGSSVEDPTLTSEMLPLLFVPQLLFASFFVATDLIPAWLRWAHWGCALTYSTRLASIQACTEPGVANCDLIINSVLNANPDDEWLYWLVLVVLFVVFRGIGLVILTRKATKFL